VITTVGDLERGPSLEEMVWVAAILEDFVHRSVDHDVETTGEILHGPA
jgi:hypothetical protein